MPEWATSVKPDVPSRPLRSENPQDRFAALPNPPDIDAVQKELLARKWVRDVRDALKWTQAELGEKIKAEGDRTVAKWENGERQPSFTYTRRVAVLAPWPLQLQFLGKAASVERLSDPRATVDAVRKETDTGVGPVHESESEFIAKMLDRVPPGQRHAAAEACAKAIFDVQREAANPLAPSAADQRHRSRLP